MEGEGMVDAKSNKNNAKQPRTISRRACDACRLRKIKCTPLEESPPPTSSSTDKVDGQDESRKRPREPDYRPCKACYSVPLECTHNMPVKRRGPPNRLALQAKSLSQDQSISAPSTAVATPPGPDQRTGLTRPIPEPSSDHISSSSSSHGHGVQRSISNSDTGTTRVANGALPYASEYGLPGSHHSISPQSIPSTMPLTILSAFANPVLDTGLLCSKDLFDIIMLDYINMLYPITPVVHVPTFQADLARHRQNYDPVFFALTIAISAYVVGAVPRKFHEYHIYDPNFRFKTRKEMVDFCDRLIHLSKPIDYFDQPTQEKWAIAFVGGLAFIHCNMPSRYRAISSESFGIIEELKVHRVVAYRGLDCIESQLRKKAFWLTFYCSAHLRVEDSRWPTLSDRLFYQNSDADQLLPTEVDDEYITRTEVFSQPPFKPSLVTAFNALSRIFSVLLPIIRDPSLPVVITTPSHEHSSDEIGRCSCGNSIRPAQDKDVISAYLDKLRYILDDLPPELGPWHSDAVERAELPNEITHLQYEAMRANIHATHLWAQSILTERLIAIFHPNPNKDTDDKVWAAREDLCRQLLQVLYNIRQANLEANGIALIYKIREVASTLLDCPFEEQSHIARRARSYISKFTDLLARIDGNTEPSMDTQLWSNLDQQPRTFPSAFLP